MNDEKLRIALAEAQGWKRIEGNQSWPGTMWKSPDRVLRCASELPEYLESRDAAIAAVIELCDDGCKRMDFMNQLADVTGQFGFGLVTATPLQICTALAKALNLPINQEDEE